MIAFKKHATPNVFSLFISFGNKWKVTEIYFKIFSKREVLLFLKKIELRVFGL